MTSVSQANKGEIFNANKKEYINTRAESTWNARILTHEKFDARLGDSFIPHFARPIVSYLGHLIIGICRDKYADTYAKIRNHLEEKAKSNNIEEGAEYLLNNSDLDKIKQIFAESFGSFPVSANGVEPNIADSRLRDDLFYHFLHADTLSYENEPNAPKVNYSY